MPFQRVLVLCETQSASSRIWTCVVVSISYNDNHYTTGTSRPYNKRQKKREIIIIIIILLLESLSHKLKLMVFHKQFDVHVH